MSTSIREITVHDWPLIAEIYQRGMDTNIATFQWECPSYAEWDNSHLQVCRLGIMAEDMFVGWAALSPVSSRCVYAGVAEVSVYIHPDYQNQGFGMALLGTLITTSETCHIWTLQSSIMQDNLASIHLHEACGFRLIGYREKIAQDRFGTWRNTVLMERRSPIEIFQGGNDECCQK